MPPESSRGSASSQPPRPTRASSSSGPRPGRAGECVSPADLQRQAHVVDHAPPGQKGRVLKDEADLTTPPRLDMGGWPSTRTTPLLGATMSATTRNKVDLPQPEGPSKVMKLPAAREKLTFSRAVIAPRSLMNRTDTSCSVMAGSVLFGWLLPAPAPAVSICLSANAGPPVEWWP